MVNYIYLRRSEELPAIELQEHAIKDFLRANKEEDCTIYVDSTPLGVSLDERKGLRDFIHSLRSGDRVYIYDLSAITQRVGELVQFFNCIFEHDLALVVVRYGIEIKSDTKSSIVIKLLNTLREKNKSKGRPKGRISVSKYDRYRDQIIQMLKEGRSVSEMAKELGVSRTSLRDYIVSRDLRDIALKSKIKLRQLPQSGCKINEKGK